VTRPDFIRKINEVLDEAERTEMFGSLEIEIRGGRPTVLRQTKTDRLENLDRETTRHDRQTYR